MRLWCEIVCHICGETTAGRFVDGTVKKAEFSAEARAEGWTTERITPEPSGETDWFCQPCGKMHRRNMRNRDNGDEECFEY